MRNSQMSHDCEGNDITLVDWGSQLLVVEQTCVEAEKVSYPPQGQFIKECWHVVSTINSCKSIQNQNVFRIESLDDQNYQTLTIKKNVFLCLLTFTFHLISVESFGSWELRWRECVAWILHFLLYLNHSTAPTKNKVMLACHYT